MGNGCCIYECLVLNDQRDLVGRNDSAGNKILLILVGDQIPCCFTGIDVKAGYTKSMVMIKHQSRTLLIGVVIGGRAIARIGHVWYILQADAFGERCNFFDWSYPLMGGPVTDPWSTATVQMYCGAILRITVTSVGIGYRCIVTWDTLSTYTVTFGRARAGTHDSCINWYE